ncbi:aldehyde dehydrogenase family protein [Leptothoe sp. PORK10 BA2]|uniref:aldehyde dehydrogenase family protein n=1 Tax=Leptothoe sp. PORK10 BA2 TaxID=3110254 RepID=UPI002B20AA4C|nr:aldehyde dehydrogenase family protein [Leptothoe sp. PORK10 BA2]MEA5463751.1 aldehyde dehydrogenase family protein [Leptothoe sp. PORK10 BA2]
MSQTLSVINPATEELIKEIPVDEPAAIAQKVKQARNAQPAWAAKPLTDRIESIKTFKNLLLERADALAAILSAETGKPITLAKNEILGTPPRIDFFLANVAQVLTPKRVHQDPWQAIPGTGQLEEVLTFDPLGVVANISAWNYPYFVGSNVFVPALLTGNAVVYKPSEIATMTGLAIANLLHESGIPPDIFVPIIGTGLAGAALLEQPIDGVFFTGSYGTGQKIAVAVAPKLLKVQLELGGKDPAYICDDVVDVAAVAAALADGAFYNNGQSCCAVERIYVHTDIYEPFVEAFVQTVQGFKLGDPTDANTYLGPLSRKPQLSVIEQQLQDAIHKGATVLCGGQQVDRPGWYFAPTVLTDVTHDMTVMVEETFGPIIGIQRVDSDEAAVALMNDTNYGLTAAVYSSQRERAVGILAQVSSGTAYWNCCDRVSPQLPWTGRNHSGIGSTLSTLGISVFLQPRGWHLKQG